MPGCSRERTVGLEGRAHRRPGPRRQGRDELASAVLIVRSAPARLGGALSRIRSIWHRPKSCSAAVELLPVHRSSMLSAVLGPPKAGAVAGPHLATDAGAHVARVGHPCSGWGRSIERVRETGEVGSVSSERRAGAAEGLFARRVGASGRSGGADGSLRCFGDSGNARVAVGSSITGAGGWRVRPSGLRRRRDRVPERWIRCHDRCCGSGRPCGTHQ